MKRCTKTLQQFIVLIFILKMRRRTPNSIKFLGNCTANVARSGNMKRSETRLEVSESRLAGRGGVWKGGQLGVKGLCYIQRRLQRHSTGK